MSAPAATDTQKSPGHTPRPLVDLLVSIVIPSILLMKFSGDAELGATAALIVALTFPLSWGLYELLKNNINYCEYDIERNASGARLYQEVNGRGVPILFIGEQRINGFNAGRVTKAMQNTGLL